MSPSAGDGLADAEPRSRPRGPEMGEERGGGAEGDVQASGVEARTGISGGITAGEVRGRLSPTPPPASGLPAVGKYELLEEIGHGGMATVYRARDPRLGREVAVKVIHKHLRENAEVAARFVAEARAAAKLRHPGIVEVYDVSADEDGERYLVAELLRGGTLRKVLQRHREMPAEVGAAIVLELCDALEHAHAGGIIHRDVKPENVLVELPSDRPAPPDRGSRGRAGRGEGASEGEATPEPCEAQGSGVEGAAKARRGAERDVVVKLTDFGIAKLLDAHGVTSTGQVLGSPAHMAPEQIEGGEIDARTDVFALGVLMYECLVGHLPFEGKNPAQVLRKVLEGTYPAADRERPSVGGRWSGILAGALARDAADRIASPGALGELIRAELAAVGVSDPRAEVAAYFADPEGYASAHARRLVPRLVSRAEGARKRGDVPGAAADYNRALALAPHDLAILKLISSLSSSASRRLLVRRAAAVVAGSAVLGVAAFGVARYVRRPPSADAVEPAPTPVSTAPIGPEPSADEEEGEPPDTAPSAEPSAHAPRPRLTRAPPVLIHTPDTTPAAMDRGAPRDVRFSIIPGGSKLVLDGSEVPWFGKVFSLAPGPHSVQITPPNAKCCTPLSSSVTVVPAPPGVKEAQRAIFKLEILPATVTMAGGPAGAQYLCAGIGLSGFAGATKTITLSDATWQGRCEFTPAAADAQPRVSTVILNAGEPNTIPWPGD
ncbi:MAG: protein kinase [Polyangiaceae bacterium]|nr:protein kinase [Polyangiaceae bacterium]